MLTSVAADQGRATCGRRNFAVQYNIGGARHYSDVFATVIDHTLSFEVWL